MAGHLHGRAGAYSATGPLVSMARAARLGSSRLRVDIYIDIYIHINMCLFICIWASHLRGRVASYSATGPLVSMARAARLGSIRLRRC